MELIRQQKTILIRILSGDAKFVLQHVQQARLITTHEYENLKDDISRSRQDFTINLLDKMIQKGDKRCHQFLELLENDEMQETFPLLSDILIPPAVRQGVPVQESGDPAKVDEYKMSSSPRGVCAIINNMHFDSKAMLTTRRGSDVDEGCLGEVFQWLGFTVERYTDKTAVEMKDLLMELSQREHQGDCFICCILSHVSKSGFYGKDGEIVSFSDILQPFGREMCPGLADKPKVFILNACWEHHDYAIPDSDFLLALATVPGLHSYRHTIKGSWFIQSLCKILKESCKRREDIITILCQVIVEVSSFQTNNPIASDLRGPRPFRQIPHIDLTLKKRLVLHVPE